MYRNREKRGEIRNLWSITKKGSSEILADENGKHFREKVKFEKLSTESENFSKIGGKSETGGKCIMVSEGMDAPGPLHHFCTRLVAVVGV